MSRPNQFRRLGSYPAYLSTPRRPSSHPRGFRLIHLSKSCVVKVLRPLALKVRERSTFRTGEALPLGEGRRNLIVRSALVNRPPRRFLSNLRDVQIDPQRASRHRLGAVQSYADANRQVRHFARTFQKMLLEATSDSKLTNAAVQAPRPTSESLEGMKRPTN